MSSPVIAESQAESHLRLANTTDFVQHVCISLALRSPALDTAPGVASPGLS